MLLSITNKSEVDRQIKRSKYFFWAGIGGLVLSMATLLGTSGDPDLIWLVFALGYPFLIGGLILSKRGAFNNRRHGIGGYKLRSEGDIMVDELKNIPARYHLYNWLKLDNTSVEHLLVTPQGILVLLVKSQVGDITAKDNRYRRKLGITQMVSTMGEQGLGNPSLEIAEQVKKVSEWFASKDLPVVVDGLVVFSSPTTKILNAEEMDYPVCQIDQLKEAVQAWETETTLSVAEQQALEEQLIQTLPTQQADEARGLAQMPGYKRVALAKPTVVKEKKQKEEVLAKPKLSPEERERIRQERIKAAQEKGSQPINPFAPLQPGQKRDPDGRIREDKPRIIEKKVLRPQVEPLRKPKSGAFGDLNKKKS